MSPKNAPQETDAPPTKLAARTGELFSTPAEGKSPGEKVDNLFRNWLGSEKTPGAAVLVMRNGEVLHEQGYGLAGIDGAKIGPETIFELASVSKQFTAMAVMLLKQEGLLTYDDPLTKYFTFRAPEADEVTIRDLLNHRSGVPDYEEIFKAANLIDQHYPRSSKSDPGRFEPTVDDVLKTLTEQYEFTFTPGLRYTYSNSGYVLLAKIIEQVSKQSYPTFMRERIFEPLGMTSTSIYQKTGRPPGDVAQGHDRGWSSFNEIDYTPLDLIYGDGSVQSNLRDMRKWIQALDDLTATAQDAGAGGGRPVRRETFREALAMEQDTDRPNVNYAFGWFHGQARGLDGIWHSGSWGGYKTMIMRFQAERFTVVVLSNIQQLMPTFMAAQVATYYLEDEMTPIRTPTVNRKTLLAFAKRYMDGSGGYYDVTLESEPDSRCALFVKDASTVDKFKLVPVFNEENDEFNGDFFIEGLVGFDVFHYTLDARKKIIEVPTRPKTSGRSHQQGYNQRSKF
jgi:CubicO group peptidase (beta-lactamase class C family)